MARPRHGRAGRRHALLLGPHPPGRHELARRRRGLHRGLRRRLDPVLVGARPGLPDPCGQPLPAHPHLLRGLDHRRHRDPDPPPRRARPGRTGAQRAPGRGQDRHQPGPGHPTRGRCGRLRGTRRHRRAVPPHEETHGHRGRRRAGPGGAPRRRGRGDPGRRPLRRGGQDLHLLVRDRSRPHRLGQGGGAQRLRVPRHLPRGPGLTAARLAAQPRQRRLRPALPSAPGSTSSSSPGSCWSSPR